MVLMAEVFRCLPTRRWLDKMGVEYDRGAKYLGADGKYIGRPADAAVNCGLPR